MSDITALNLGMAFVFGIFSFFSPCVLPLLPGYLAMISGTAGPDGAGQVSRRRAVWNSIWFTAGFGVLFVSMGAAASSVGQWLAYNQDILMRVAGVIIIIFGLHVTELLPVKIFYREARWHAGRRFAGGPGAFVLGLSFSAGWTPCVGPVLASILLLAGSLGTLLQGVVLLVFFSLGLAIPFILAAAGVEQIQRRLARMNKSLPYIKAISGGLLIAMGILLLAGLWNKLVLYFY